MSTIALAMPHCPWDPHRVKSFARIREQLEIRNDRDEGDRFAAIAKFAEVGPTPNHVWSGKMFEWMAAQTTDYVMQVQDDVLLAPRFMDAVTAALKGAPNARVISFYTIAPQAQQLSAQGCNWMTTTDWMTGPCWITTTAFMREFWKFRSTRLRDGWDALDSISRRIKSGLNEDTLLGLGAAALGEKIWNPLPALVDHDTSMPSNYGNAHGRFNRASFTWKNWQDQGNKIEKLYDPEWWKPVNGVPGPATEAVHMGLAYSFTPRNFMRWVIDDGTTESYGGVRWAERCDKIENDIVRLG